jgi:hypothetical protein
MILFTLLTIALKSQVVKFSFSGRRRLNCQLLMSLTMHLFKVLETALKSLVTKFRFFWLAPNAVYFCVFHIGFHWEV